VEVMLMFKMNERVMNNEVVVNTGVTKAKHLPNDPATEAQRRYCYRIMKRMIEKNYALPPEITGYYIYHLMTFKEAYVFIQRYKGVC
jgi:hypothetical protein